MSEPEEKKDGPITLDLGDQGGQFVFHNAEDFHLWINAEAAYWSWLQSVPQPGQEIASLFRQRWKGIASGLKEIATRNLSDAVSQTLDRFAKHLWFHSLTPRGRFLEKLRLESPLRAIGALSFLLYLTPRNIPDHLDLVRGYTEAQEFQFVASIGEQDRINSANALHAKYQEEMTNFAKQQEAWRESAIADLVAIKESAQEVKNRSIESVAEVAREYEEKLSAYQKELGARTNKLAALEVTYESKLRLEAPVAYWKSKERAHKEEAHKLQRWTAAYFVFGTVAVLWGFVSNLHGYKITTVPIVNLSTALFVIAIFIWAGRLLIRTMLSNMHLAADAHERYIMAQTYLALIKSEGVTKDTEKVALEALMRHSSDGIVNDDAAPWLDALKILKKS